MRTRHARATILMRTSWSCATFAAPFLEQKASHSQSIPHLLPPRVIAGRSERCILRLKEYSSGNKFAGKFWCNLPCIRRLHARALPGFGLR